MQRGTAWSWAHNARQASRFDGPRSRQPDPDPWPRSALPSGSAVVVVLAADLPAVNVELVDRLRAAIIGSSELDGAVVVDDQRRAQPLLAAYRRRPLERAVAALGDLRDRPVRAILDRLTVAEIVDTNAADDIDTPADLARWTHDRHGRP